MKKTILLLAAFATIAAGAYAQTQRTNRTNSRPHSDQQRADPTTNRVKDDRPVDREDRTRSVPATNTNHERTSDPNNTNNNTNTNSGTGTYNNNNTNTNNTGTGTKK